MSSYTPQIAWAAKNALADSDSAKIVSGADFHTEFSAVQTAVNTKQDADVIILCTGYLHHFPFINEDLKYLCFHLPNHVMSLLNL